MDVYEQAKSAGLLDLLRVEHARKPSSQTHCYLDDFYRDRMRGHIKVLQQRYRAWLAAEPGRIADPGPRRDVVEPMDPPLPTESVETHQRYRKIMDEWFDDAFLPELLPRSVLWEIASNSWIEKQAEERARKIRRRAALHTALLITSTTAVLATGAWWLWSWLGG